MPNIASLLKDEIARVSRKQVRQAVDPLRKQVMAQRRDIAALKRERDQLKREIARLSKTGRRAPSATEADDTRAPRFSVKGLKSLRARLGLSAEALARLAGVSGQSIYNWESGKARPRAAQVQQLAALRGTGKREVQRMLEELDGAKTTSRRRRKS